MKHCCQKLAAWGCLRLPQCGEKSSSYGAQSLFLGFEFKKKLRCKMKKQDALQEGTFDKLYSTFKHIIKKFFDRRLKLNFK